MATVATTVATPTTAESGGGDIVYRPYVGEADLPNIMALVQSELSEPYVIYTYRYFLHQWPHLSFLAYPSNPTSTSTSTPLLPSYPTAGSPGELPPEPVGVIVCKQSMHRDRANRGYIAMLSVNKAWRKRGIARTLVRQSIDAMKEHGVEEVFLETEHDNAPALALYESLGFIREKRLFRFYMNGKDAFRLILALPPSSFAAALGCTTADLSLKGRPGPPASRNVNVSLSAASASFELLALNRDESAGWADEEEYVSMR